MPKLDVKIPRRIINESSLLVSGRIIHGVKHAMPDVIVKSSKGSYVYTECGRSLLDFSCGIGVTNLGHSHERVSEAVINSVTNLVHAQQNIFKHRPMVDLVNRLSNLDLSVAASLNSWFLWNSGAEAVEAAVKLARQATGKPNIVAVNLGYHGRTIGTMALTSSSTIYRAGFGPLMGGVHFTPFPYLTHSTNDRSNWLKHPSVDGFAYWGAAPRDVVDREVSNALAAFELLLRTQSSANETAAIIIEPVLGEGGYLPSPPGFLSGLRKICDKNGILLIADEVQTGFGRTGSLFACEWIDDGVSPDILVLAKGLGNGIPISAIGTRNELASRQPPGSMGGTYGGNAVGCAAALAVIDVFEEDNILDNVMTMENELRIGLSRVSSKHPGVIREIRGRGLMIGVEFERLPGFTVGGLASAVASRCHQKGLIILNCGPYDTLRFIPPLTISSKDIQLGVQIFDEAVAEVIRKG
uniref:Acetylornithine transaminase n=1 Tax=Chromulina nebulosa TaxID=96789 RepID=A0A7S0SRI1_9STRA|mmetsp:Transcript_1440/g.1271  ORF Transcript_1440/g.1271 Transcript_1440/m.1271 type:complete len:469 (+) Transcript_1440:79-1485(+)